METNISTRLRNLEKENQEIKQQLQVVLSIVSNQEWEGISRASEILELSKTQLHGRIKNGTFKANIHYKRCGKPYKFNIKKCQQQLAKEYQS